MKIRIDLKKTGRSMAVFFRRLPYLLASHAFVVYLFFLTLEILCGAWIYYHLGFPEASYSVATKEIQLDKEKFDKALEEMETERKGLERTEEKEYFELVTVPKEVD